MTHWKSLTKGDYLTAAEFNGRTPTFTIVGAKSVAMPVMDDDGPPTGKAKEKDKGVVYFKEVDRGMVLNKTNGFCIEAMFGKDVEGWDGKRVTLHAVEVQVGPKRDLGIRVVGSPDIERPIVATVTLPRKKPIKMTMVPTGRPAAPQGKAPPPAQEKPIGWGKTGEPDPDAPGAEKERE